MKFKCCADGYMTIRARGDCVVWSESNGGFGGRVEKYGHPEWDLNSVWRGRKVEDFAMELSSEVGWLGMDIWRCTGLWRNVCRSHTVLVDVFGFGGLVRDMVVSTTL